MLKIYLMGLAITALFVSIGFKLVGEKIENTDDVKYLLFFFTFWFIALPVLLIRTMFDIYRDGKGGKLQ